MKLRSLCLLAVLCAALLAAHAQTANSVRFSDTTPAAPSGTVNVTWQHDEGYPTSNISAHVPVQTFTLSTATPTAMNCLVKGDGAAVVCASAGSDYDAGGAAANAQSNAEAYADSVNTTGTAANLSGSHTANTVYAAPYGSAGSAGFRALAASDLPVSNYWFVNGIDAATASSFLFVQNKITYFDFALPQAVSAVTLTVHPFVADTSGNLYDIGIFSMSGTLLTHVGPLAGSVFSPATSFPLSFNLSPALTLPAGSYLIGFTTNCASACASLRSSAIASTVYSLVFSSNNAGIGSTSGGSLPPSFTPNSPTVANLKPVSFALHN